MKNITWQWSNFEQLTTDDLYQIVSARESVFIVEQDCAYQECDGLDQCSYHLIGWMESEGARTVGAYLRVIEPGRRFPEPAIGRVLTTQSARGLGLGKELMRTAIARTAEVYPGQGIRISAQNYLKDFYEGLGFQTVSAPYDEDGIPHIEMFLTANSSR